MRIDEALERLDALAAMTHRVTTYDGLRAAPIFATGCVGLLAAALQPWVVPHAASAPLPFVVLWCAAAAVAMKLVLADMLVRYLSDPTARARRMTVEVLQRLAPSVGVGGALTLVLLVQAPELAWILPGLWANVLGLGIAAACPLLPNRLWNVAWWYITSGLVVLVIGPEHALHPLTMAIPFGGGQLFTAALIRFGQEPRRSSAVERSHE